jgi:FkbM family methyltransferase
LDKQKVYEILNEAYFSEQMHEKEVINHLPDILRATKLFVDIGASLGQYTYFANKLMKNGHIISIEPDPIRYEKLETNCKDWEKSSSNTIKCMHGAVSDSDGRISFFTTGSNLSGGLFKHDTENLQNVEKNQIEWKRVEVDSFSLDSLFRDNIPDVVKIDVEGSELRVLKGGQFILKKGKTVFLIELHKWEDPEGQRNIPEVIQFMNQFGYKQYNFYGKKLFSRKISRFSPRLIFRLWLLTLLGLPKWGAYNFRKIFLT